ncbi:MAG TPA: alpha/beta hydrolase [Chitinophagales bacterium]|nr:alpha/beta hydrolase [Chitinophagales bacterium]HMY22805.1 alpha/beta hydrolase [Chitinophagales bacterium]HMZ34271.1 alpha/beta hydrolase [Chitinophagales bacterium]HNB49400.1 alpha/beta hydrolase [Chitinophagales bacterium]HNC72188.1 alpha/beta hydrolase [Chitinophagales bacterium]
MSTKTYFIGGIASDERLFRYQMTAIENAVYLPFPKHDKHDTMETYVKKFIPLIDTSQAFNIVGNSMGGIMTMELIKHIQAEKVVLISSVKCRKEMPFILKQLKYTNLHKVLPGRGFIGSIQFGSLFKREVLKQPAMRKLAISMAKNNDTSFLYWCVNAIVKWQGNEDYRKDILHIHGTKDEMFPYRNIQNAIPVQGGSHAMLLIQHKEVNELLKACLYSENTSK